MRYQAYADEITKLALAAPADACDRFAVETIRMMAGFVERDIETGMLPHERRLLRGVLADVATRPPDALERDLEEMDASLEADGIRGTELAPDLVELLCAVQSYIGYRRTGDRALIADVACHSVIGFDYRIIAETGDASDENVWGSPPMIAECERQKRMLAPGASNTP